MDDFDVPILADPVLKTEVFFGGLRAAIPPRPDAPCHFISRPVRSIAPQGALVVFLSPVDNIPA